MTNRHHVRKLAFLSWGFRGGGNASSWVVDRSCFHRGRLLLTDPFMLRLQSRGSRAGKALCFLNQSVVSNAQLTQREASRGTRNDHTPCVVEHGVKQAPGSRTTLTQDVRLRDSSFPFRFLLNGHSFIAAISFWPALDVVVAVSCPEGLTFFSCRLLFVLAR